MAWQQASSLTAAGVQADLVRQQMASGVKWLSFDAPLERAYEADTSARKVRQLTTSALIGLLLYNTFLIADYFLIRDVWHVAVMTRLTIVTPVSILIYIVMQQAKVGTWRNILASANVVLVISSSAYLLVLSHDPLRAIYNQNVLLVIVYACLIQRIQFWYAVGTCLVAVAIFTLSLIRQQLGSVETTVAIELTVILGTIFTLAAAYNMEREHRLFYLVSLKDRLHATMMEGISNRDPLTGLLNRRALDAHLLKLADRSLGWQESLAVIILDIDHFKIYNDRLGHQAGDDCLKRVSQLLVSQLREGRDHAFRYGGEEFLLLIRETDADRAIAVAERIRRALENLQIPHPESSAGAHVTASFGVAHADALRAAPAELIARADMALYAAKNNGRNRVWPPATARPAETAPA